MRQIVLDTETTGLDPHEGHRIIEIGCIEIIDRRRTERSWHSYLNPERNIDSDALSVHGITNDLLLNQPRFVDIVAELLNFIRDSELLIHNAPFDLGFLNHELQLTGEHWGRIEDICQITDTLILARTLYPSQKNSLDALCKRHGIDNSQRTLHGALLDAEILSEVYLAMTGGQVSLLLGDNIEVARIAILAPRHIPGNRPRLPVTTLSTDEDTAHREYLTMLNKASAGNCLWQKFTACS